MIGPHRWLGVLLSGCGPLLEEPRHADLQVDISGADWHDEDRVRICVEGVGTVDAALGAGKVAFTGLPPEVPDPFRVQVDLLKEDLGNVQVGSTGEIEASLALPWQEVSWSACPDGCPACAAEGERVEAGAEALLLAVRFL